nr:hypothetical protein [Actinomycetota bacterium]
TIALSDNIEIRDPYLTVAGQTAPAPGILIRGAGIEIQTHDVLIQHIRVRVGDDPSGPSPGSRDGFRIIGSSVYNIVLDHVSTSWSIDELFSIYTSNNVTVSRSIFAEGLDDSLHPDGPHSKAVFVAEGTKNFTFYGNLVADNIDRNPAIKGNTSAIVVNNLIYNWGNGAAIPIWDSSSDPTGLPSIASVVGNVFIEGPDSESGTLCLKIHDTVADGSAVYLEDNEWADATSDPWSIAEIESLSFDPKASSAPVWTDLSVRASSQVEGWVLQGAGAWPAYRDDVDSRVVDGVQSRSGRVIDSPSDVGGYPSIPSASRALQLPSSPNGDDDGDGYTNLEELLHELAATAEGR